MVLVLPSLLMFWWGSYRTMQARSLRLLDPLAWRHSLLTLLWSMVAYLLVLLANWAGLGVEARKRARQAEELRRAIGMRE
jgi:ABC-type Fe3+ transport system permease subunit